MGNDNPGRLTKHWPKAPSENYPQIIVYFKFKTPDTADMKLGLLLKAVGISRIARRDEYDEAGLRVKSFNGKCGFSIRTDNVDTIQKICNHLKEIENRGQPTGCIGYELLRSDTGEVQGPATLSLPSPSSLLPSFS